MHKVKYGFAVAIVAAFAAMPLQAQQESVEQRLQRVERLINSQSLLEMLERIDTLQAEVELLRGRVEEQQHTIEGLKNRQRELYLDIDRRVSQVEREGSAPTAAATATQEGPARQKDAAASDEQRLAAERAAYQQAFDMLRQLQYAQATTAFRDFLEKYPNGRYAHIAQYWLGEAGYAQRDFKQAIVDYRALIANHTNSPKRAEAMLKIGYSYYELKQYAEATEILEQLIADYPDSTESGQARSLLKQIRKQTG